MNASPAVILTVIAIILAVGGIIKPSWPLVAVAALLEGVAILLIASK